VPSALGAANASVLAIGRPGGAVHRPYSVADPVPLPEGGVTLPHRPVSGFNRVPVLGVGDGCEK